MHCIHKILVNIPEATDSKEIPDRDSLLSDIREYAESMTEGYQDVVFDWRETDTAGRWSDEYPVNVILGKDDVRRFADELELIFSCQREQIKDYQDMITYAVGDDLSKIVYGLLEMYSENDVKNGFNIGIAGYLKWLADILFGEYTFDSGFFNTSNGSGRLYRNDIDKIKKHPEDWALVMFDYHI